VPWCTSQTVLYFCPALSSDTSYLSDKTLTLSEWLPDIYVYVACPKCPYYLWGVHSFLLNGGPGSLLGVKLPGHEVDHSPPSSVETENEWSCTCTPPVCLHGGDMYVFQLHVIWLTVIHIKMFLCISVVGWDGVVSVVTCCGLVSPGFKSWWGQDLLHLSRLALGPLASFTVGTRSLSPGVKWPGRSIDHPPLFSAKFKERVELYLFSSGPSWPVLSSTYLLMYFCVK
jgi:hypothetical protein